VTFGFPGGNGYLEFTVPANADKQQIVTTAPVEGNGTRAVLQLRSDSITGGEFINFTNFCLRPRLCTEDNANYCNLDGWRNKTGMETLVGNTREECCDAVWCISSTAVANCSSTKWEKKANFSTKQGGSVTTCCQQLWCDYDNLCVPPTKKAFYQVANPGSTIAECCKDAFCDEFEGCQANISTNISRHPNGSVAIGNSAELCCRPVHCHEMDCHTQPTLGLWKNKTDQSGLGATPEICCDQYLCDAEVNCSDAPDLWAPMPALLAGQDPRAGGTHELCCEEKTCGRHYNTCQQPGAEIVDAQRQGSNESMCCMQLCKNYNCSSTTEYTKLPDRETQHEAHNMAAPYRGGYNDTMCCQELLCTNYNCQQFGGKWSTKSAQALQGLRGSTTAECCTPNFCSAYNCSIPTKWSKKVDTNFEKHQGRSDEECCVHRLCTEFNTSQPETQWTRNTTRVLGSTEIECYDAIMCNDRNFTCLGADQRLGSTLAECCP